MKGESGQSEGEGECEGEGGGQCEGEGGGQCEGEIEGSRRLTCLWDKLLRAL